jgi:small-conductance mechanosensitive channel
VVPGFLEATWLGNSVLAWALAASGALVGYAVLRTLVAVLTRHLRRLSGRDPGGTVAVLADVAAATRSGLVLLLAIAVATKFLHLPDTLAAHTTQAIEVLFGVQVALWLTRLIVALLEHLARRDDASRHTVVFGILSWAAQLAIWLVLVLAILSNAGLDITAFIASLGVGGIAVALAAQNILGDLFASISIGLDKPFQVGEYIAFGGNSGTVLRVGVKSTRIRSISGEELSIANSKLLQELVHNYDRMTERRIAFGFGVALNTSRADVERVVLGVKAIIGKIENARLGRGHMTAFGESSLNLEFVYYMLDPGFDRYRDVQQQINFAIMDLLDTLGVKLAVPARVVHSAPQGTP